MSEKAKKKLTPTQQEYQDFAQAREPKRSVLFNCVKAFLLVEASVFWASLSRTFLSGTLTLRRKPPAAQQWPC